LKKETFANARSVHSELGGGMKDHDLGDVMAIAPYVLHAGQPFVAPIHPGVQDAHPVNGTQAQITAANRLYDKAKDDYTTYIKVHESLLKQQILMAVKPIYYQDLEDDTFGYADVAIPTILEHLTTTNGQLTAADLENNRAKVTEQWNPLTTH
jgi:hypothetical protein